MQINARLEMGKLVGEKRYSLPFPYAANIVVVFTPFDVTFFYGSFVHYLWGVSTKPKNLIQHLRRKKR